MSQSREDVYLTGTDLMVWRGHSSSAFAFPWCNECTCASAGVLTLMCVVFDWSRTVGDASVPCSAQPDAHRIWHCRASCVTGMWQGRAGPKWLLRLHYPAKTPDTTSPISHFPFMVTDPLTIHKWSTDCTLPFSQYSLITYRWKLARTKIIHSLCCKSKREVRQGAECQEPASSGGVYPAGSSRCWYLHCHSTLWCFDTGGL